MEESPETVTIFVSYAHEDDVEREVLTGHLSQIPGVDVWDDRAIPPGSQWDDLITERLESADIILLLISRQFLTSKYVEEIELARAHARHDAGSAIVIPVLVRMCILTPKLGKFQALPSDDKLPDDKIWLTSDAWTLDQACYRVAKGVMSEVDRLRETRGLLRQRRRENEESYRKKVAKFIADDGEISDIERDTLEELREQLELSSEDADRIEQGELWPIKEKRQNLAKYEKTLRREIQKSYPFSRAAEHDLTRRQEDLLLTDSEVDAIEKRVIDEWKAGVLDEARAKQIEREAAAAEHERAAAEEAERITAEKAATEEAERISAEKAEQRVAAERARVPGGLGDVRLGRRFDHGSPVARVASSADRSWIARCRCRPTRRHLVGQLRPADHELDDSVACPRYQHGRRRFAGGRGSSRLCLGLCDELGRDTRGSGTGQGEEVGGHRPRLHTLRRNSGCRELERHGPGMAFSQLGWRERPQVAPGYRCDHTNSVPPQRRCCVPGQSGSTFMVGRCDGRASTDRAG